MYGGADGTDFSFHTDLHPRNPYLSAQSAVSCVSIYIRVIPLQC
jgi:hypothetical protein